MTDILTRDASVQADMLGIFEKMERRRASPIVASGSLVPQAEIPAAPSRGRIVRIVAPAIVLLAFALTAALMWMPSRILREAPSGAAVGGATSAATAEVSTPVATLPAPEAAPQRTAEPLNDDPTSTAAADRSNEPSSRREAADAPREPSASSNGGESDRSGTDIAPAPRARSDVAACWRDPDQCLYQDVLAADQRLVRAYQRAREAGAPVAQMRDVRRRWDRALDRSLDEPGQMIDTYHRLADELDRTREAIGRRPG